jgi:hypothetical protein
LRIEKVDPLPYKAGETAKLNIWIMNDNPHSLDVRLQYLVVNTEGFNSDEQRKQVEEKFWATLRASFNQAQLAAKPDDHIGTLPSKVESTMTLNVDTEKNQQLEGNKFLTEQQAASLQKGLGPTTVFFMLIFAYQDDGQWHDTEYCGLTQGAAVVRCYTGHNGPAKSSLSHWWE